MIFGLPPLQAGLARDLHWLILLIEHLVKAENDQKMSNLPRILYFDSNLTKMKHVSAKTNIYKHLRSKNLVSRSPQ